MILAQHNVELLSDDGGGGIGGGAGADGVMATYKLLVSKEAARLTEDKAPKLHEYLARRDRKDMKKSQSRGGMMMDMGGGGGGGAGDDERPFSP